MTYIGGYHVKENVLRIPRMWQFLRFGGFKPQLLAVKVQSNSEKNFAWKEASQKMLKTEVFHKTLISRNLFEFHTLVTTSIAKVTSLRGIARTILVQGWAILSRKKNHRQPIYRNCSNYRQIIDIEFLQFGNYCKIIDIENCIQFYPKNWYFRVVHK